MSNTEEQITKFLETNSITQCPPAIAPGSNAGIDLRKQVLKQRKEWWESERAASQPQSVT